MQALQASLMTHEIMAHQEKRLQELEGKYEKCLGKLRTAQDLASNHLKIAKEVQDELDEFIAKVKVTEVEMHEEAQKLITRHAMKARIEAVAEYFKGEHASWDMNEMVRIYNEAYPDDVFPLHVQGGDVEPEPPVEDAQPSENVVLEGKTLEEEDPDKDHKGEDV